MGLFMGLFGQISRVVAEGLCTAPQTGLIEPCELRGTENGERNNIA